MNNFRSMLTLIFSGIIAFSSFNGFLYYLKVEKYDYILANALSIIIIYLFYLTHEIHKIKKEYQKKED